MCRDDFGRMRLLQGLTRWIVRRVWLNAQVHHNQTSPDVNLWGHGLPHPGKCLTVSVFLVCLQEGIPPDVPVESKTWSHSNWIQIVLELSTCIWHKWRRDNAETCAFLTSMPDCNLLECCIILWTTGTSGVITCFFRYSTRPHFHWSLLVGCITDYFQDRKDHPAQIVGGEKYKLWTLNKLVDASMPQAPLVFHTFRLRNGRVLGVAIC